MSDEKRKPPFVLDISFDEALKRFAQTDPKELTRKQPSLSLSIAKDTDVGGIGMGGPVGVHS